MDELDEIRKDARTGQLLREGAPQAGMEDLRVRLNGGDPAAGQALRNQPPQDMSELRNRLTSTQPAQAPAVPPRNVPLNSSSGLANTIAVDSSGNAGVVRNPNINPAARGGMSPQAEEYLKSRAATPGSAVPAAAETAGEAAPAAARTISGVARAAGPLAIAAGGLMEGRDVMRVAQDPNKTKMEVATQASESAAKLGGTVAGAALGAQGGAALGAMTGPAAPVAVPVLGLAGGIAGGIVGREGVERGIAALRNVFGLDPKPPVATAVPQYERDRAGTASAGQRPPQGTSQQAGTGVQQPSAPARTISGVAAQASQPKTPVVDYKLGQNAVEVINPGGERFVTLFGPNGEQSSVPSNVFSAGSGAIAKYADEVREAQSRALTDPEQKLAKQRLENEGHLATQEKANEGHIAGVREQVKAPVAIKNALGETAGFGTPQPGGDVKITPVPGPKPALAKAHADAKAAVAAGADPGAVNSKLQSWGYPSLNFSK